MVETNEVDMKEIIKMLKERQGDSTPEVYAPGIGIASNTLRAYYSGRRSIGAANARVLIGHFRAMSDTEMADAIGLYFQQKIGV
jgi:hypothetical protein